MFCGFAEADAGVDDDLGRGDAGGDGDSGAGGEKVANFFNYIEIGGFGLHVGWGAEHVH